MYAGIRVSGQQNPPVGPRACRGFRFRETCGGCFFRRMGRPRRPSRPVQGTPKNAAPAAYSAGTTSARSRYSFRISQEVSAMSAQP